MTRRWIVFSSSARCACAGRAATNPRNVRNATLAATGARPLINRVMSNAVSILLGKNSLVAERLRTNVPLAPFTTFKIGGPADVLYDATTADDIANAVDAARSAGISFFVLGLGANILIGDRGVRGLVIRNTADHLQFPTPRTIRAERGAVRADLTPSAGTRGLPGHHRPAFGANG